MSDNGDNGAVLSSCYERTWMPPAGIIIPRTCGSLRIVECGLDCSLVAPRAIGSCWWTCCWRSKVARMLGGTCRRMSRSGIIGTVWMFDIVDYIYGIGVNNLVTGTISRGRTAGRSLIPVTCPLSGVGVCPS
jgi:hypothetical protein